METLPLEIGETAHALRKSFDRRASALGATRAQWKVLLKLTRQPGLRQVELADMLEVEPITLCRIIDRLEDFSSSSGAGIRTTVARGCFMSPRKRGRSSRNFRRLLPSLPVRRLRGLTPATSRSPGESWRECARTLGVAPLPTGQ